VNCAQCQGCRSAILSEPGQRLIRLSERYAQGGDKATLRMIAQDQMAAMALRCAACNRQTQASSA
jgi:hypothetical protein